MGAKLFIADGQTDGRKDRWTADITNLILAFCNFTNAP